MTDEIKEDDSNSTQDLLKTVERLEAANKEHKVLIQRQEELAARNLLGGQTNAGTVEPIKKEIDPREYAKNVLEGKIPQK